MELVFLYLRACIQRIFRLLDDCFRFEQVFQGIHVVIPESIVGDVAGYDVVVRFIGIGCFRPVLRPELKHVCVYIGGTYLINQFLLSVGKQRFPDDCRGVFSVFVELLELVRTCLQQGQYGCNQYIYSFHTCIILKLDVKREAEVTGGRQYAGLPSLNVAGALACFRISIRQVFVDNPQVGAD
ncbi:hypothetical protein Barb7_02172 [Bacteroidales bacterium Barb7]|nr:hypothetical protein Barb7_02172 [Bacteroidales bacterium Barb7]